MVFVGFLSDSALISTGTTEKTIPAICTGEHKPNCNRTLNVPSCQCGLRLSSSDVLFTQTHSRLSRTRSRLLGRFIYLCTQMIMTFASLNILVSELSGTAFGSPSVTANGGNAAALKKPQACSPQIALLVDKLSLGIPFRWLVYNHRYRLDDQKIVTTTSSLVSEGTSSTNLFPTHNLMPRHNLPTATKPLKIKTSYYP